MTLDRYIFDEESWDACAAARLSVPEVLRVLHGDRRLRRSVGSTGLMVTGGVDGVWITISLIEVTAADDTYVVRDVFRLSPEQAAAAERLLKGWQS